VPKEQGVRQSVNQLVANMTLVSDVPQGNYVILDDVFTQGNHITATIRKLPKKETSAIVVVAGKTENAPLEDMTVVPVYSHWCIG